MNVPFKDDENNINLFIDAIRYCNFSRFILFNFFNLTLGLFRINVSIRIWKLKYVKTSLSVQLLLLKLKQKLIKKMN